MIDLKTENLVLRRAQPRDVGPLWDVFSRPEAMRYWSELPHLRTQRTQELVQGMIDLPDHAAYYTVEHQGQAIGTAGFWEGNEIGFILHPKVWRKGFGMELLSVLIPHGFQVCGYDNILADVDPGNAASLALLERNGFVEIGRAERTLQVGDQWVDSVYLTLTRDAWSAA